MHVISMGTCLICVMIFSHWDEQRLMGDKELIMSALRCLGKVAYDFKNGDIVELIPSSSTSSMFICQSNYNNIAGLFLLSC